MREEHTMSAPIEVLAIRPYTGSGSVKAFVDLQIGGITLKGCKVVQQDGQKAWIAMPSSKTNHGWQNTVEVSKALRERITEVVLEAWEAKQGVPPSEFFADVDRAIAKERDR
jgi:DNA-binding cell septation regulator SpoVG